MRSWNWYAAQALSLTVIAASVFLLSLWVMK